MLINIIVTIAANAKDTPATTHIITIVFADNFEELSLVIGSFAISSTSSFVTSLALSTVATLLSSSVVSKISSSGIVSICSTNL